MSASRTIPARLSALYSLSLTKREQSMSLKDIVDDFLAKGNRITVCRPAFAHGVETPLAVRQAIRAEGRA